MVGCRVVSVFSGNVRPPVKTNFFLILNYKAHSFPLSMRHYDRKHKVFSSGTEEKPAVHDYGGIYDRNSVLGPLHQNDDKGARNYTRGSETGTN